MKTTVKRKRLIHAILLLVSMGITTSCIDKSYDLDKDIDMTINVGGQYLAFPIGSTEKITMDKIIEIENDDDLQIVNGEYHLLKKGTINDAKTDVKGVMVKGYKTSIDPILAINKINAPISGSITTPISEDGDIKANAKNIDNAVKRISELKAKNSTELLLKLTLTGDFNYTSILVPELKVNFPDFLQFEADNKLTNNTLTLKLTNQDLKKDIPYEYRLKLTGYKFKDGREIIANSIEINDKVSISGEVTVSYDNLGAGDLTITPIVVLADMDVASVTGIIQPAINETSSTIELSNLPDFLQDDAVELDITNPVFTFIAKNPLDAPIVLNGEMFGTKNNQKIEGSTVILGTNSVDKLEIILKGNSENIISLSRLGSGGPADAINIKVSDINNLIKKIPDVVKVSLQPKVTYDKDYTVKLGQIYSMNSSYNIDIPLSFGNGLQIVYKDTIDDLRSDLKDVEFKKAIIAITADNIIPLKLEIKDDNVIPKDVNGKKINDVKVTVTGTISESKDGKTISTSQLAITMEETKEGAMNQLDGFIFKVTAVPGQANNIQLRSDQWMQLKDMKLRVPNGLKVDLN